MWLIAAALAGTIGTLAGGAFLARLLWRPVIDAAADKVIHQLLTEPYEENLWELVAGFGHNPVGPTMENALRAQHAHVLHRPIGTSRRFRGLSGLMFNPAQLCRTPLPPDAPVSTRTVLGPEAARPLVLEVPLLVSAIGYGVAVSARMALALAEGSAQTGTAYNVGEGPLLSEVRRAAHKLVIQYTGTPWTTDPKVLRAADMVEIRFGQGAWGGLGANIPPEHLTLEFRKLMGLKPGEGLTLPSQVDQIADAVELRPLVQRLRDLTGGVPIGVKLAASHDLEAEIDIALTAGIDVIAVDGAQGGTHGSPPILADDFGLPTFYALVRAVQHLQLKDRRGRVSLIISGGLNNPGDYLKCLALGADAVYLGSTALFATIHAQVTKTLPWEPPTQLVFHEGKFVRQFEPKAGARSLANFLRASAEEMATGARALGKRSLQEVDRHDLFALDPETAHLTGVPLAYGPRPSVRKGP